MVTKATRRKVETFWENKCAICGNNDYLEIWEEYENLATEEAKFVKNIDQLEFLLQACAYGYDAAYFEKSINSITNPYCK